MVNFNDVKEKVTFPDAISMLNLQLTERGGVYRGKCPACNSGGDRTLVITPGKGFYCFAKKAGGDVIALAAHIKGIATKAAAEFLIGETPSHEPEHGGTMRGMKPLDHLDPAHEKVLELVTEETARFIGMGYTGKGIMRGVVAVPLHDPDGTLIGYVGLEEPYRLPTGFLRTQHVFNAHRMSDEVFLLPTVEDCLRAMENGIETPICFLTTTVDPVQLKLLAELLESKKATLII